MTRPVQNPMLEHCIRWLRSPILGYDPVLELSLLPTTWHSLMVR
jgi:hypothetical protein